jgi:hypothetical protein
MSIGPKMTFILRIYQMTGAEAADDADRDRDMVRAGKMSEREYSKRASTRHLARAIRKRDEAPGAWPRDPKKPPKKIISQARNRLRQLSATKH